ncbi:hypothetical protein KY284_029861 [Solanum tuberosum]|nr:hypothetical protein KY284_029861 [Solanum tuberosum]
MTNARIARFVTEVAPPQFVNVMRHRASKMLETIKEEEREASTSEALSLKSSLLSSSSTYSALPSNAKNSKSFLKEVQRFCIWQLKCLLRLAEITKSAKIGL